MILADRRTNNAIILVVAPDKFKALGASEIRKFSNASHELYDLKYVSHKDDVDIRF